VQPHNDSLTRRIRSTKNQEDASSEKAASLREEDYQLAYAIDILKALSHLARKSKRRKIKSYEKRPVPQSCRAGLLLFLPGFRRVPTKSIGAGGSPASP